MNKVRQKHYTIPVFVPEHGCPFQCIFCNQQKISGRLKIPTPEEVDNLIREYLTTIPWKKSYVEIGFFGGNFTGIKKSEQESYLQVANPYVEKGIIKSIRLSTRPDYIDTEILQLLKKYHVKTIELGAQSLDEGVLMASGRGHTVDDIIEASGMVIRHGFGLGLQMMIGLPGDTLEKSKRTARQIVALGADNTRIYPTLVIRDTKLAEMYLSGDYKPLSLEVAVKWSKEVYKIFEKPGVKVIRLGLHPSEGLISGDDLLAGPFHISFRELVLSQIWHDIFMKIKNIENKQNITIFVAPRQFNYAIGYEAANRKALNKFYKNVRFVKDPELQGREYYVDYC